MTTDQAREYTVIVNGGSGCFFQPADPETTYILTAKHNIINAGDQITDLTHFQNHNGQWEMFDIPFDNLVTGVNYFPHPGKDIAIIKVPRMEGFDALYKLTDLEGITEGLWLLGYPETRRNANPDNKEGWFRLDRGVSILGTTQQARREAQVPNNPGREEIIGHSGGCILKDAGNKLYLAGIQNSMAQAVGEQLGRIEFTPIQVFNEVIELYPDELSPIFPFYLLNFEFLQEEAFNLDASFNQQNIEYTKNFLRWKCEEVINNELTPIGIKNLFEERLLIDQNCSEELENKVVWLLWLEFLTILNISQDKIHTVEDLSGLFNNYRLLFSSAQHDWCYEIDKIMYADFKGLKKQGLVVVAMETPPADGESFIIDNTIPQIANTRNSANRSLLKIDDGVKHPFEDFKFVHIDFFKGKSIIKRHQEYAEINSDEELLIKLKQVYGEVFTD
ncbi:ABC-three component system protein [Roseivirga pacifica]|uniref:ABC-three component system protein n=1 Tax=Roseivirga pacifica TaxID=1267423 RepID=UPI0020959AAD|nr:ABC-three component system protein [Roseivirga pacifica]MCO6359150.1 hypothetical protein [Roseivirga pacifica]MCO6365214.1 hypothetical protein [Roseivirga pacifica]MCO6372056.1 hypothetical protein [Roseivirga pacifica]MCO6375833.1 hypothetical protein [Roseivirga pacifica]MCO6379434.1 hypothetical protein [Roseivirga pacifica]